MPWGFIFLMFAGVALAVAAAGLAGRPLRLPVWAVAEAEARINAALAEAAADAPAMAAEVPVVSLGAAQLTLGGGAAARLDIDDLRLMRRSGEVLAALPRVRLALDPTALAAGRVRLASLRVTGARLVLRRLEDGRLDLALGGGLPAIRFDDLGAALDAVEAALARPLLEGLTHAEAEAMTLTVEDRLAGRTWEVGDGRLRLENRADSVAAQAGLTLIGGGQAAARLDLTAVSAKADGSARLSVAAERVIASDLAVLAPPLAFLSVIGAPISGWIEADLGADSRLAGLTGGLDLGAGEVLPGAQAAPVSFDRAALAFGWDPARERLDLTGVEVQSPSLRLRARGHAYLPGARAGVPREMLVQVALDEARVDPEGLFVAPAVFSGGALDLRLRFAPLALDIGQAQLLDGGRRLSLSGHAAAEPGGWRMALDLGVDAIASDRLLALWPLSLVPRTREWLAANVQQGELNGLRAAVRLAPGQEPRISLRYDYAGADVRFLRTLPPIEGGAGHAALDGTRYTLVLDRGRVTPPEGGALDMAGSVFTVPDIGRRPARAEITLRSRGSLTATLSLIDQPPFGYVSRAGQPVDLGEGEAELVTRLSLPLVDRLGPGEVDWSVGGRVRGFASAALVPGRRVEAAELSVRADPAMLEIAGQGRLDGVPFDAAFRQPLGPGSEGDAPQPARIEGTVEVSGDAAERLRLGLPRGLLGGTGQGRVTVELPRGRPPVLRLESDLRGVSMALPEIGWSKAAAAEGRLTVAARLGGTAAVERIALSAPGLEAQGSVSLRPGGGMERARFERVRAGAWFDGAVTLTDRGAGPPGVEVPSGTLDLRRLPAGLGGRGVGTAGGTTIAAVLDRVQVTEGIALTGLRGTFRTGGAFTGEFLARVNGQTVVQGRLTPDPAGGSAVRLVSEDGGGVLAAAGLFPNARGGQMLLTLRPRGGGWDGRLELGPFRLRGTPILAELLNAVSVVGLLEQLNGQGLAFQDGQADFRLTPRLVEISRASAVGASMGISLAGIYDVDRGRLDMQGVISPVYLVNAVGAVLTRRGEGLFGFNYTVRGTVEAPQIGVNPLSILTPGMFRDIFRRAPPRIGGAEGALPAAPPAAPPRTGESAEDRR